MKNDSIEYYNKNSKAFYDRTINANLADEYKRFLKCLPKKARILDAGCGVGRDSKYFLDLGYDVTAFDASLEMVKMASNLLKKKALLLRFEDICFSQEFDAIWANASLIHVPFDDLASILEKFRSSLVPSGILYASFKYGSAMRQVDDRLFFDMDEVNIKTYIKGLFEPLEVWKSEDVRSLKAPSPDKSWLNLLAKAY